MNQKEVFNHIFESFEKQGVNYVIIHSYQKLPEQFDSDIDTAIVTNKIGNAIQLLDTTLHGTGWRVIQYWRHENYAVDCIISNDIEFLQVDFCIHYERNGRVILPVQELVAERKKYNNFYIPNSKTEFVYILLKKILKKNFSERSKEHLTALWKKMNKSEKQEVTFSLNRFFCEAHINEVLTKIDKGLYNEVEIGLLHHELLQKTASFSANLHYKVFDCKRIIDRILHPTGLFIVLLGVDGAGKTTIAEGLKKKYANSFRRIRHYHSRVRVLKDISQIKVNAEPTDASNPHGKKGQAGKAISVFKFGYYFIDFLIGNIIIQTAKIKSSLVLIERYYYDYSVDKIRYNLNLSDGFLRFFGHFIKKPDVIFILTGDSRTLLERKHEITLEEIDEQKKKLKSAFQNHNRAIFIDTTFFSVEECVSLMLQKCNAVMRGRREW